ncbi:MAG TPA: DUF3467 domain-containing protein [Phycisphaerae bacterium]|nr:DUF3467 domain-containing protein [Phycisphaerae bacterium]
MLFDDDGSINKPQQPQQQQIHLDASQMQTVYANFFALSGAADEVTCYLGTNMQLPGMKAPAIRLSHRLILLPANAKRLMLALQQTVKAHEDRFGPIEIPPPPRPPAT